MSKPSIPGMGHPSTPGNTNKRPRTGSAAHLVLTGDDRPIRTIEKFMAEWNEYEDYQKVDSEVFKAADKELKSLKKLREYREEHEDEDVDAVALSSLERKHLSRMNVKTCKDAVSIDTWESLTVDQFDSDTDRAITYQQIDECWEQGKDAIAHKLGVITEGVPNEPEPFSRLIIDLILLLLLELINKEGAGLLFVELPISKGADFPTCIQWVNGNGQKITTFLTGRVDYLLLVYQGFEIARAKAVVQSAKSEDKSCLRAFVNSKGIQSVWNFSQEQTGLQGVVFEAKVEEDTELIAHLPQVVGECLITMDVTRRNAVPWCLTTGKTWVFGVAVRRTKDQISYDVHHGEPISWNTEIEREQVMERVFMMLAYWATMGPDDVTGFADRLPRLA